MGLNTLFERLARPAALGMLAATFSACNMGAASTPTPDLGEIQTQAVVLVSTQRALQLTQTALAASPTPLPSFTPLATSTPGGFATLGATTGTPFAFNTPGALPLGTASTANGCNDGAYVGETGPADKTVVEGGKEFTKAFTIDNTGTCAWAQGYVFDFLQEVSTPGLNGKDIVYQADEKTEPGHGNSFVERLTPPASAGEYWWYFKLKDASGNYFGPRVYAVVVVE